MREDVFDTIDRLQRAIENDERRRAVSLLDDLRDAYRALAAAERPTIERAKRVTRGNIGDQPSDVLSYLEEVNAAQLNRAGLLVGLETTLTYPDETDEDPASLLSTIEERERAVQAAAEAAADDLEGVALPALPYVLDVTPPDGDLGDGTTGTATVRLLNAGDAAATGLEATATTDDRLAVVDGPADPGRLAAGASTTLEVTLRGEATGDGSVTVEVRGDPQRTATGSERIEVVDAAGFVDRAADQLTYLRTRVDEASPPDGGQERQLLAKLEAAADSLEAAERYLDDGETRKADKRLKTASKQLGAFINAVEAAGGSGDSKGADGGDGNDKDNDGGNGGGGRGLPEATRVSFERAAEDIVDTVAAARETID